jgi:hypothetical protein
MYGRHHAIYFASDHGAETSKVSYKMVVLIFFGQPLIRGLLYTHQHPTRSSRSTASLTHTPVPPPIPLRQSAHAHPHSRSARASGCLRRMLPAGVCPAWRSYTAAACPASRASSPPLTSAACSKARGVCRRRFIHVSAKQNQIHVLLT